MTSLFDDNFIWWVSVIEIPVLSSLFWMIFRLRDHVAAFKLEVAKSYASIADLKDLEVRIVSHLIRIESKLDRTALKAEKLSK